MRVNVSRCVCIYAGMCVGAYVRRFICCVCLSSVYQVHLFGWCNQKNTHKIVECPTKLLKDNICLSYNIGLFDVYGSLILLSLIQYSAGIRAGARSLHHA